MLTQKKQFRIMIKVGICFFIKKSNCSFNSWMTKTVIHPENEIQKEWPTDTCNDLDGSQGIYIEWKKKNSQKTMYCMSPFR